LLPVDDIQQRRWYLVVGVDVEHVSCQGLRPSSYQAAKFRFYVAEYLHQSLFAKCRNIAHVFFNGSKPEKAFRRHVLPALLQDRYVFARLPSTSPAHAAMRPEAKVLAWSVLKKVLP
jgi:hypothetical protein